MKKLLQPYWLFLVVTIPQLILVFLYANAYVIINSLLETEHIRVWGFFGGTLLALITFFTFYAIYKIAKKQKIDTWIGFALLLTYIPFLVALMYNMFDNIFPRNVPRWMLFEHDLQLYIFTFLMPALAYGLFLIVLKFTPSDKEQSLLTNFALTIIIPIFGYSIAVTGSQFVRKIFGYRSDLAESLFISCLTIFPLAFLFFLIRFFYILLTRKADTLRKYRLIWMIPLTIILPLIGLALNNGIFADVFDFHMIKHPFGNFSHYLFYILTFFNGVILCLPEFKNRIARISIFLAKCFTFSYTMYFFLVFLPYLPLSVIITIGFGLGFLMLAPLIIAIIHSQSLMNDFAFLKEQLNKNSLKTIGILSFLLLPAFIVLKYSQDRQSLHKALNAVYESNNTKNNKNINTKSLERVLKSVKLNKKRIRSWHNHHRQPYLSPLYQWLVLDNLTLSNQKIHDLEKIFFGKSKTWVSSRAFNTDTISVKLDTIITDSQFNKQENYYKTWVNLQLRNRTTSQVEYATTFSLPESAYISDYYLMIEGRREHGILAEKKAAMWVYQQITSRRRDPGILYYLTGNKIAFRVFPFNDKEKRQTGIEIIHKYPFTLQIDNQEVLLGDNNHFPISESLDLVDKQATFISAAAKNELSKMERTPYYHFLVDCSKYEEKQIDSYIKQIEKWLKKQLISPDNAKITAVNYYTETFDITDNWQEKLKNINFKGGFFLEKALIENLVEQYVNPSPNYPIFVAVSDSISKALFTKSNLANFQMTFPENDSFYVLNTEGQLNLHSLTKRPLNPIQKDLSTLASQHPVCLYTDSEGKQYYLPDNNMGSFIFSELKKPISSTTKLSDNQWISALELNALWKQKILYPDGNNGQWLSLVKNSFAQHIMTPVTSFIAVENEAQKAALAAKQEQVLNAKETFDAGEINRMTAPPIWLILLLFLGSLWCWRRKDLLKYLN